MGVHFVPAFGSADRELNRVWEESQLRVDSCIYFDCCCERGVTRGHVYGTRWFIHVPPWSPVCFLGPISYCAWCCCSWLLWLFVRVSNMCRRIEFVARTWVFEVFLMGLRFCTVEQAWTRGFLVEERVFLETAASVGCCEVRGKKQFGATGANLRQGFTHARHFGSDETK